jgi:rubredoxin
MEVCHKCTRPADYICPVCGTKSCRSHMELRYTGQNRGLKSRYMCPKCWKTKQVMLNQNMVNARRYRPKKYVFYKVPIIGK